MRLRRGTWGLGIACCATLCSLAALLVAPAASEPTQKKKKEEQTQTLQLPKELPGSIEGETRHLTFYATPPSGKGLLSQQIRDAVKALEHRAGADTILKIRAFVAGPGDVRRVRDLVSGLFTEQQKPLPVLSLIRCGLLPVDGAQVVLEGIATARKPVNPYGLAFIGALPAISDSPLDAVPPLMAKAVEQFHKAVQAAGATSSDVIRVTCFVSSLNDLAASRTLVEGEFPHAAVQYVQTQRAPARGLAACEGVARLTAEPAGALRTLSVEGASRESGESQVAMVGAQRVVLTGTQVSFGYDPKDGHLAFERLQRELEQAGTSPRNVAFAHYYPLAYPLAAQIRQVRRDFFDAERPPASSMLVFEGLTSMDAGFAVDVVAVK